MEENTVNVETGKVEVAEGIEFPDTSDGRLWVAGAVVIDERGNAFAQRRSATRKVFPHCWDIVGGHVEEGESMLQALSREIREETGWALSAVVAELYRLDWDPGDGRTRREVDYLVRVDGDLAAPALAELAAWLPLSHAVAIARHGDDIDAVLAQQAQRFGATYECAPGPNPRYGRPSQ